MSVATWIAVAVCGPGALGVLLWFLADLLRLRRRHRAPPAPEREPEA